MELKIAFIGMGNVGLEFARILDQRRELLDRECGMRCNTIAIITGRHGAISSSNGLDLMHAVRVLESGGNINDISGVAPVLSTIDFIDSCAADVILETIPLNPRDGEPAAGFIRRALRHGISVVTANKGPVAFHYRELSELARQTGASFRFEGTVMDGTPVFNLAEFCLSGTNILGFSGILNSTTNLILTRMEEGASFEQGLHEAQSLGIAEANASYDIDGWDAAVKTLAVANVLMDAGASISSIEPTGIRGITSQDLASAASAGETIRLISRASRNRDAIKMTVQPERVCRDSLFGGIRGTSNVIEFETDLMGRISVVEHDPGVRQTSYALLSDLIRVHQEISQKTR